MATQDCCVWKEDRYGAWYSGSSCDVAWPSSFGTPKDNNVRYCWACGKPIKFVHYKVKI